VNAPEQPAEPALAPFATDPTELVPVVPDCAPPEIALAASDVCTPYIPNSKDATIPPTTRIPIFTFFIMKFIITLYK
jgi:hypothetical protein